MGVILVVAILTGKYSMLASLVFGVVLIPLAGRAWRRDRRRVERAHRLNA
jgi:hypothetical protein